MVAMEENVFQSNTILTPKGILGWARAMKTE
jgi:hypothetical protein